MATLIPAAFTVAAVAALFWPALWVGNERRRR